MVLVIDSDKKPLTPCRPRRARLLLNAGKAKVYRKFPFTIILQYPAPNHKPKEYRLKLDPGSKTTGLAVINEADEQVVFAANIEHRGQAVTQSLSDRRAIRRSRRNRKTRYRKCRFNKDSKSEGWIAPSLMSRVHNVISWVKRLTKYINIKYISQELVRFDTQQITNPEISGVEYQQGTLFGYEVREYLLEKFNRKCIYCGAINIPLEIEHIVPKSRGGSNRISNLTLSCNSCNVAKGNKTAEEFGFPDVQKQAKASLKDAAAVNSTRWKLFELLKGFGHPVEVGTGGRTKFNRIAKGWPKEHWVDAVCVGASTPDVITMDELNVLNIKATGHGRRQKCSMDKFGFPRTKAKGSKQVKGFQTGDIVKAVVTKGVKVGTYIGKVAVRASGSFNITTAKEVVQGISYKYCRKIHSCDGYSYSY